MGKYNRVFEIKETEASFKRPPALKKPFKRTEFSFTIKNLKGKEKFFLFCIFEMMLPKQAHCSYLISSISVF